MNGIHLIDDIDPSLFDVSELLPEAGFGFSFVDDRYPEDRQRLERYAVRQRFRTGDEIVGAGRFERSLIIVASGELALVCVDDAGRESVDEIVAAPSMVGEAGFFDPAPWPAALRARTDGELLRLSFARFEALAASSPLLGRTILFEAGRVAIRRSQRRADLSAQPRRRSQPWRRSQSQRRSQPQWSSRSQLAVAA